MIRAMEKRSSKLIQKKSVCPKCGSFCRCEGGKYVTAEDGTQMYVRYRYCTAEDCDGSRKDAEILEF